MGFKSPLKLKKNLNFCNMFNKNTNNLSYFLNILDSLNECSS
jgi:hypothetical protein